MRKTLSIIFAVIAAATIGITSCNQLKNEPSSANTTVNNISSKLDSDPLIQELLEYNQSIQSTAQSRLSDSQKLQLVFADGIGAYKGFKLGRKIGLFFGPYGMAGAGIGAILVGTAASIVKYKQIPNVEMVTRNPTRHKRMQAIITSDMQNVAAGYVKYNPDSLELSEFGNATKFLIADGLKLGLDSAKTKAGIQHNLIVENLGNNGYVANTDNFISTLSGNEKEILNNEHFKSGFDQIRLNPLAESTNPYADELPDEVFRMYLEVLEFGDNSQDRVDSFTMRYIRATKNATNLTDVQKESLLTAFSVARYSYAYWSDELE